MKKKFSVLLVLLIIIYLSSNTFALNNEALKTDDEITVQNIQSPSVNSTEQLEQKPNSYEFTIDDLNFSKYSNFAVGLDKIDKFLAFYGKWARYYKPYDDKISKGVFYGESNKEGYSYFTIFVTADSKTDIVKEVFFTEMEKRDSNAEMKTHRGITTGSSISDLYNVYGKNCDLKTVTNNPKINLANLTYNFAIDKDLSGKMIFYVHFDKSQNLEDAIVDGIRIVIN